MNPWYFNCPSHYLSSALTAWQATCQWKGYGGIARDAKDNTNTPNDASIVWGVNTLCRPPTCLQACHLHDCNGEDGQSYWTLSNEQTLWQFLTHADTRLLRNTRAGLFAHIRWDANSPLLSEPGSSRLHGWGLLHQAEHNFSWEHSFYFLLLRETK